MPPATAPETRDDSRRIQFKIKTSARAAPPGDGRRRAFRKGLLDV
jgi:hypothetical protein